MTDVSRRAVLGAGLGVLGLLGLRTGAGAAEATAHRPPAASAVRSGPHVIDGPERAHFASSVGRSFAADLDGRRARLKLAHIRDVAGAVDDNLSFNLIFTAHRPLVDGIYTVRRRGVATHALFLSRVGPSTAMQAVVNRRS